MATPIDRASAIGSFVAASPAAVARAVAAAQRAFAEWSGTPWAARVAILRQWAEQLDEVKFDLAIASLLEVGKSRTEALGEAEEAIDLVRYYCGEMERHQGYVQDLARVFPNEETTCVLRSLGVIGVISPFNYPIALAVNMMAGALTTGNTVVFKPSAGCTLSAQLLLRSMAGAGLPKGAVNLVAGGDATGRSLVAQSGIAGIAFTGSHEAGMGIFRDLAAAPTAKLVIAEMGGKNPAYVTAAADLDIAAQGVARSAFGLQGQKCSACSVVYVQRSVRDDFVARLARFAQQLKVGNPEERDVFMGPLYTPQAAARFRENVTMAGRDGQVIFGGHFIDGGPGGDYAQPTLVEVPPGHVAAARGAVSALAGAALLRPAAGGARRRQCRALRPDRGHLHHRPGRARSLSRSRRSRRALRQPCQRGHDRRLARHPELLWLEGLRREQQGWTRSALPATVHAGAVAHDHALACAAHGVLHRHHQS